LAALGITSINYGLGTYTRNGVNYRLSSVDLEAESDVYARVSRGCRRRTRTEARMRCAPAHERSHKSKPWKHPSNRLFHALLLIKSHGMGVSDNQLLETMI
jgi:hypothetical protein